MGIEQTKKKIIDALKDKKVVEDNGKCCLLIIPFCSKEDAEEIHGFKRYARNLLEVDDEFYEGILEDYKDYKNEN